MPPPSADTPSIVRPADVLPWNADNLTARGMLWPLNHTHATTSANMMFLSTNPDELRQAIYASQFRRECTRYLLLYDDTPTMGLGMHSKMVAAALLMAMRDNRVLLEHADNSRWCRGRHDRRSLQCYWEPWTHCPHPANASEAHVPWVRMRPGLVMKRHNTKSAWHINYSSTDVAMVRTSYLSDRGFLLWGKTASSRYHQPTVWRFLFRARPWVRAIGDCHMRKHGLRPHHFALVHIRHSPEKQVELHAMGLQQPPISAYANVTVAAARLFHFQHVFLQTASMQAERDFTHALSLHGLHESHTDNPRASSDTWAATRGKRQASSADVEGVIAAVNAYIGSLAAVFLSLANSMWTFLQRFLFPHGTTVHLEPIACSQAGPQRSAPLILFVAGKPSPDVEAPDAREEYLKALNGAIRCNGNKMESTAEELARAM